MSKKIIVELTDGQYEHLQSIPYGSIGSRIILDRVKKGVPFEDREKGEWIIREDNTSFVKQLPRRWVECSCCGWSFSYDRIRDDYCSKCGADMRGKADE